MPFLRLRQGEDPETLEAALKPGHNPFYDSVEEVQQALNKGIAMINQQREQKKEEPWLVEVSEKASLQDLLASFLNNPNRIVLEFFYLAGMLRYSRLTPDTIAMFDVLGIDLWKFRFSFPCLHDFLLAQPARGMDQSKQAKRWVEGLQPERQHCLSIYKYCKSVVVNC